MKLSRLAVNELRQFSVPFELVEFEPGLNLIAGANETGKSSLVRALQAAFFERYGTKSVEDLRPWSDTAAAPEVQVDFEHEGQQYRLLKRFLKKSQCRLIRDSGQVNGQNGGQSSESYEGDQAEALLQQLLGFSYPGKGASKEEYWGIPGLLWITQGSGQDLARPIAHAHDFLRETLSRGVGEIATSGGDALVEEIAAERSQLLTQTGKPTGELKRLMAEAEDARQALADVERKLGQYRQAVDRLAQLRTEFAGCETARPWEEAERKKAAALAQLAAINRQREALDRNQTELKRLQGEQQLLFDQLGQWQQESEQLALRGRQLDRFRDRLAEVETRRADIESRLAVAAATLAQAEAAKVEAEGALRRQELEATIRELQQSVDYAAEQLARARAEQDKYARLQRELAGGGIDEAGVEALVRSEEALRNLQVRREAVATRIRYRLDPGKALTMGGITLEGSGEATLIEARTLDLPGLGALVIEPGGADLATLASRERDALRTYTAALDALKVASVAEARRRLADRKEAEQQLQWLGRTLADLAPQGLEALANDLGARETRLSQLRETLASLSSRSLGNSRSPGNSGDPEVESGDTRLSLEEAASAVERALKQHQGLAQERQRNRDEEVAARTQLGSAEAEQQQAQARMRDPARQEKQRQGQNRLLELSALIERGERSVAEQLAAIDKANPQVLEDDIQRLSRSAAAVRAAQNDRGNEIARLEGELSGEGAASLGEDHAELKARSERLDRHLQALERRAGALDLLYRRLQQKRTELVERLQAPLQKHVAAYLRILFPEAELKISEAFQPGKLVRNGAADVEFDALSFGAREQIGVILRLAYADALKEAGRPTLIVLDDALVHSDRPRREAMQRVLYNASHRHQILLFTCHPDSWGELGVTVRSLEGLKAEAGL